MISAMKMEISRLAPSMGPFDTIYVGGGTPSSLSPELLTSILSEAKKYLAASHDWEITVELNPADINDSLLQTLQQAGVNRLSLGVQSFDDKNLKTLGRRHDSAQALQAIDAIRDKGFASLGVDLIYGLPGCPQETWTRDLRQALAKSPEHISCYALTIAPNTPFGRDKTLGLRRFPDDGSLAKIFMKTSEAITDAGYIHYEVSNFALGEKNISHHNSKYWQRSPYLGIGPSAHSFDSKRRWWNIRDVDMYCRQVRQTGSAVMGDEYITPQQAFTEEVALGMRTSMGMEIDKLLSHGVKPETLRSMEREGLIVTDQTRVRPTIKGFLMADGIAAELV